MGIKNLKPRLAEIGKIKIGKKGAERQGTGGKKYRLPTKLDHFEVTTLDRDENGDFIQDEDIMGIIGQNPKSLDIILLYDDIDLNFPTRYAFYLGTTCKCSGDGETAQRIMKTGEIKEIQCDPDTCEFYQSKKCKIGGTLNCLLKQSSRLGGVYKFRTHGWHSVNNILSSLQFIQTLTCGVLAGIGLKLTLSGKKAEVEGKSLTVYTANVEYHGNSQELLANVVKISEARLKNHFDMKKMEMQAKQLQIAEDPEAITGIIQEYYPQNQSGYEENEEDGTEEQKQTLSFDENKEVKAESTVVEDKDTTESTKPPVFG